MTGPRQGSPNVLRRLIARATSRHLQAFVAPGASVARASGLDLDGAGLHPVATPRRANVLVILTPLPQPLIDAAVVVYAQMPRPRTIIAVGDHQVPDLPTPDVEVAYDQESLSAGVARLREVMAAGVFNQVGGSFRHDLLEETEHEDHGSMDHHHHHHGDEGESDEHASHDHSDHGAHGGHDMDHSGHDEGFMSMIAMTKDLPRSPDRLQMDWLEVPFGPLHPGLPAGLNLALTLDGDRIAGIDVRPGVNRHHLGSVVREETAALSLRLSALDRLAPGVYGILAEWALGEADGASSGRFAWVVALERARILSHLGWLASFGELLGYRWLAREAAAAQLTYMRVGDSGQLRDQATRLNERAGNSYQVRRRLDGVGRLDPDTGPTARGPVARAMGMNVDARLDDPDYTALGFTPVIYQAGDALARLKVRLDEISQSIDLIEKASSTGADVPGIRAEPTLEHPPRIETPRGEAVLAVSVENGRITASRLDTPSTHHMSLIRAVAEGLELSEGLVGVASLDISPWEVDG